MSAARAVLFDFNGTLSDDEPLLCRIYREMFASRGRPLTEDEYYRALAGQTEEAIIGGWLGVGGAELMALIEERIDRYTSAADGSSVRTGTRAAVRFAAGNVPVGVVSGAYRREIEPVVMGAGLDDAISVVVAADDVEHGKPHPEGYLRALSLMGEGLVAGDVVAFEDTEAGVASAKAARLRCVGVLGTMGPERLKQADEVVERIDVDVVRRLLR
jgi:beta-phosphoglucomutase